MQKTNSEDSALKRFMSMKWTGDPGSIPYVALGSLALGGGGRLVKNLFDLYRRPPDKGLKQIARLQAARAEIPVPVTEEEAEELRRRGVSVRTQKRASDTDPHFPGGLFLGALGTAGAIGGWSLVDKIIDASRKNAIRSDIQRTQQRIEKLLEDDPEEEDAAIYGHMKAAEDVYFSKAIPDKYDFTKVADSPLWAGVGVLAGIGGVTSLFGGYQQAKRMTEASKAGGQLDKLRKALMRRATEVPEAVPVPVLITRDRREEDEEGKEADELPAAVIEATHETSSASPAEEAGVPTRTTSGLTGSWY